MDDRSDARKPRFLPHNDEAEMALLGAVLHNNKALEKVSEFCQSAR